MEQVKKIYKKVDIANNFIYVLFVAGLLLAFTLLVTTYLNSKDQRDYIYVPQIADPVAISNVILKSSDGTVEKVKLPVKKDADYTYAYNFVVEENSLGMQQYVNVNVNYTSFIIRHKDEIIYQKLVPKDAILPSMASSSSVIEIPNRLIGKQLEIEFISNLSNTRPLIVPQILVGTKSTIRKHHFYKDIYNMLAAAALFITAIFIAIIGAFFAKIGQTARNLFIAVIFAIIISSHLIFRSWLVLYYLNNAVLAYYIKYTCFLLVPLPIFLLFLNVFYENDYYDWRARSFEYFVAALFVNFIAQWTLTLLGVSEFVLMQKITAFLHFSASIYIPIAVATIKKNRIKNKRFLITSIMPLAIVLVITILVYYQTFEVPLVPLIIMAVVFFILVQFILALKKYVFEYSLAIENDFYSQLAYFDSLTHLSNRHDFEKDVQRIIAKEISFMNLYLIMLDMNNLKEINDNYGHKMGDAYLKMASQYFIQLEKKYNKLKVFRYGGDEFIMLAYDKKESEIQKIIDDINDLANKETNLNCDCKIDFALGYAVCNNQNSFEVVAIKAEADKRMYESKMRKKGGSANVR